MVLAVAGCGAPGGDAAGPDPFGACAAQPNACNGGGRRPGGTFVVALTQAPAGFNVVATTGAVGPAYTVMNSLLPHAFSTRPDGSAVPDGDLLASVSMTSNSPQTVVYQIAPGAVWSDGTPIGAADFSYAWKTQNGRDCPACPAASSDGYDQIASVAGSPDGRTVTVTFRQPYPDWRGLFNALYPAHLEGAGLDLSTADGLRAAFDRQEAQPTWSGGPYTISAYQRDRQLDLVPNPRWYGADKPTLARLRYRFLGDQSRLLGALQTGDVNALTAQPSQDLVDVLHGLAGSGVRYEIAAGPVAERLDLDVHSDALADPALRRAIFTTIDVDEILRQSVRGYFPGVRRAYSHNLSPGVIGYQDVVRQVAPQQGSGDPAAAGKILAQAGYAVTGGRLARDGVPVPVLRLRYTQGDDTREQAARLIQRQLARIGVTVHLDPTGDLATALAGYDYDLALFGWPVGAASAAARDLWSSAGTANHTGWGDPDSDALLKQVAQELDPQRMADELNQQDGILTQAAVVLPLYQRPVLLALSGDYVNVRANAPAYLSYNAQQWGLAGPSPLASVTPG
ncbi:MAG TPA: ABC transporter family substrate-binding protein [Rugosimonospora sp.]|nr:ABC transporter family substrate-binding protein [Rugosimonospora sp.]